MDNAKNCAACPVADGTHKPVEAVHQIAEPQPEALRLAEALEKDVWRATPMRWAPVVEMAATKLRAQDALIADLQSQLDAIGAGGVEPLRKPVVHPQEAPQATVWMDADTLEAMKKTPASEKTRWPVYKLSEWTDKSNFVALTAATQPAAQGMDAQQYRLLDSDELIEAGDEFLRDDFTWKIDPNGLFVGFPLCRAPRPARRPSSPSQAMGK